MYEARKVVERRGFRLRAISGISRNSWEFKTDDIPNGSLDSLYKDQRHRAVDLHAAAGQQGSTRLRSARRILLRGVPISVLSPVDLFIDQGLHLYKHICGEFYRPAHLIEFRNHVIAHRDSLGFWLSVRRKVNGDKRSRVSLGVVILLISKLMGDFAPDALSCWTVEQLPDVAKLWVERYGVRSAVTGFPGNKLYLLLERELTEEGIPAKRTFWRVVLPLCLPPMVVHAAAHETMRSRASRYWIQIRFICLRLRFHMVSGLQLAWHSLGWRMWLRKLDNEIARP
jgi:hypothetical protein